MNITITGVKWGTAHKGQILDIPKLANVSISAKRG